MMASFLHINSFCQALNGCWESKNDTKITTIIATDQYLSITDYDIINKKFEQTWGGKYTIGATNEIFIDVEFHSLNPNIVNSSQSYNITLKKKSLEFNDQKFSKNETSKPNALNGLWRITARANTEGKMSEMLQGPRKTLKIMSGGHFQWFAINTQSREFFGTGGGTYTLNDGNYAEKILFFPKDSSRVGAELHFQALVKDKEWIHSGKSSKGEDIKEIWKNQN